MNFASGSAPGRLDVMGGVADYAGALVLEWPTAVTTTVVAEPADHFTVGPVAFSSTDLEALSTLPYPEVREELRSVPPWTRYPLGVALVLLRHGVIDPPLVDLRVSSDVPQSVGVSSSAALEVATARALTSGAPIDQRRLALLCQVAENEAVGAPCGVMDQLTVALGTPGSLLPILCRPAEVRDAVPLHRGLEVVGVPTGVEHDVGGSPYRRARAAAFMGKAIVEAASGRAFKWISELDADEIGRLPEVLAGSEFLDRWGATGDPQTDVQPDVDYPVQAATGFGRAEHARSEALLTALRSGHLDGSRALFGASHAGYAAMGLGHPSADRAVEESLARPGVLGARSSGGGSGGTVVVLCQRGALDDLEGVIR